MNNIHFKQVLTTKLHIPYIDKRNTFLTAEQKYVVIKKYLELYVHTYTVHIYGDIDTLQLQVYMDIHIIMFLQK